MKARFGFLVCLLLATSAQAQSRRILKFEELPKLVREKNENVQAAQTSYKSQERKSGRFARSFLPSLAAQVGAEEFRAGSDVSQRQGYWKVEGSLNLYRGNRDRLADEAQKARTEGSRLDTAREYNVELSDARRNYWKLVAINQLLKDRKLASEKNGINLQSAKRRASAGISTAADSLQFELHQTLLNQELKRLEHERDVIRNHLSLSIGHPDHETLEVEETFPHPSDQGPQIPAVQVNEQIELRVASQYLKAEHLTAAQFATWWAPTVDLYSSYGLPSLSDEYARALRKETEWKAGIRLGFDFGKGIEERSEAQALSLEADALQQRAAYRAKQLVAEDHEIRHDMQLVHELIHDADKDIEKAERFLKLTESEYARGVKNGPDLLQAFQKLFEFRQRRTELYRDYHESMAELVSLTAKADGL